MGHMALPGMKGLKSKLKFLQKDLNLKLKFHNSFRLLVYLKSLILESKRPSRLLPIVLGANIFFALAREHCLCFTLVK